MDFPLQYMYIYLPVFNSKTSSECLNTRSKSFMIERSSESSFYPWKLFSLFINQLINFNTCFSFIVLNGLN